MERNKLDEPSKKPRLALIMQDSLTGDSFKPDILQRFPFKVDHYMDQIADDDYSERQPSPTEVLVFTPDSLTLPEDISIYSSFIIYFPKGIDHEVQNILNNPTFDILFTKVEQLASNTVVFTDSPLQEDFVKSFRDKYYRTVLFSFRQKTQDAETGLQVLCWDISCFGFIGELQVEQIRQGILKGTFSISRQKFLLKFLIRSGVLTHYEYTQRGSNKNIEKSYYWPDKEGTFQNSAEYSFGQLQGNKPHGYSNSKKRASQIFYDCTFVHGKPIRGTLCEQTNMMMSAEVNIEYDKADKTNGDRQGRKASEIVGAIRSKKLEGVFIDKKKTNLLTSYRENGEICQGFYQNVERDQMKDGVTRDQSGSVIIKSPEFEAAAKAYQSLMIVKVGSGDMPQEFEEFADVAVRLCNKLAFPYEQDHEPPRQLHQFSEKEFAEWCSRPCLTGSRKIVHVVLWPNCLPQNKYLKELAMNVPEGWTLITSDFGKEQNNEEFYTELISLQKDIILVSQAGNHKLNIWFEHNRLEAALALASSNCLQVSIDISHFRIEAIVHNKRVMTTILRPL